MVNPIKKRLFIIYLLFFPVLTLISQGSQGISDAFSGDKSTMPKGISSSLTIYILPAKVQYDWESPHTLYCSLIKNYIRNMFRPKRESYLLGHAFIELRTPLHEGDIFSGMRATSVDAEKRMLLKEHTS